MNRLCNTAAIVLAIIILATYSAEAQRVAVVSIGEDTGGIAERIGNGLSDAFTLIDPDMAAAAFRASSPANPQNMTRDEARIAGSAIGCDYILVLSPGMQRRAVVGGDPQYEAYAIVHLVDTRSGELAHFDIFRAESAVSEASMQMLKQRAPEFARSLALILKSLNRSKTAESNPKIDDAYDADAAAPGLIMPIPYRRIRPDYTQTAALYGVTATVEIELELAANGSIIQTRIVRWAGFGLDEAVTKAVRTMSWRPAFRNSKPLPIRVLLRYNFKKLDTGKQSL